MRGWNAGFSYGYNSHGSGMNGASYGFYPNGLPESQIKVPTDMIALGDTQSDFWVDWILSPALNFPNANATGNVLPSKRHNQGANMLFCDGHVEYGKRSAWIAETPESRKRWNYDNRPHPETW